MSGGPTVFNLCIQSALTLLAELTVSCASFYLLTTDLSRRCFISLSADYSLVRSTKGAIQYPLKQPMYGAPPTV
jgi:hypothetical protein